MKTTIIGFMLVVFGIIGLVWRHYEVKYNPKKCVDSIHFVNVERRDFECAIGKHADSFKDGWIWCNCDK